VYKFEIIIYPPLDAQMRHVVVIKSNIYSTE
jgi:hypothetical protein